MADVLFPYDDADVEAHVVIAVGAVACVEMTVLAVAVVDVSVVVYKDGGSPLSLLLLSILYALGLLI